MKPSFNKNTFEYTVNVGENVSSIEIGAIKENDKSDVFNIGSEHGNSVKEVFEACENVLNKNIKIKIVERREGDPSTLYADSSKAKKLLKWAPKKSLKDSIRTAYAWELKLEEFKKGQ